MWFQCFIVWGLERSEFGVSGFGILGLGFEGFSA